MYFVFLIYPRYFLDFQTFLAFARAYSLKCFQTFFSGKLKPTTAFMTGKMKIQGDMGKAMKLEKLMGKMQQRGYHTMPNHQRGKL